MDYDTNLASTLGGLTSLDTDEDFTTHNVSHLHTLKLGRQGENKTQTIRIDCSGWMDTLPGCTLVVAAVRPGETETYLPEISVEGGIISWPVAAQDTSLPGHGSAEVRAMKDGQIKKSAVIATLVEPSLTGDGTFSPVTPPDWVQTVLDGMAAEKTAGEDARKAELSAATAQVSAVGMMDSMDELKEQIFKPDTNAMIVLADLALRRKLTAYTGYYMGTDTKDGTSVHFRRSSYYSGYYMFAPKAGHIKVKVRSQYGHLVIAKGVLPFNMGTSDFWLPCTSIVRYDKNTMPNDYVEFDAGDFVSVSSNTVDTGMDVWIDLFMPLTDRLADNILEQTNSAAELMLQQNGIGEAISTLDVCDKEYPLTWEQGGLQVSDGRPNANTNRIRSSFIHPYSLSTPIHIDAPEEFTFNVRGYTLDGSFVGNLTGTLDCPADLDWNVISARPECAGLTDIQYRLVGLRADNADITPDAGASYTVTQRASGSIARVADGVSRLASSGMRVVGHGVLDGSTALFGEEDVRYKTLIVFTSIPAHTAAVGVRFSAWQDGSDKNVGYRTGVISTVARDYAAYIIPDLGLINVSAANQGAGLQPAFMPLSATNIGYCDGWMREGISKWRIQADSEFPAGTEYWVIAQNTV